MILTIFIFLQLGFSRTIVGKILNGNNQPYSNLYYKIKQPIDKLTGNFSINQPTFPQYIQGNCNTKGQFSIIVPDQIINLDIIFNLGGLNYQVPILAENNDLGTLNYQPNKKIKAKIYGTVKKKTTIEPIRQLVLIMMEIKLPYEMSAYVTYTDQQGNYEIEEQLPGFLNLVFELFAIINGNEVYRSQEGIFLYQGNRFIVKKDIEVTLPEYVNYMIYGTIQNSQKQKLMQNVNFACREYKKTCSPDNEGFYSCKIQTNSKSTEDAQCSATVRSYSRKFILNKKMSFVKKIDFVCDQQCTSKIIGANVTLTQNYDIRNEKGEPLQKLVKMICEGDISQNNKLNENKVISNQLIESANLQQFKCKGYMENDVKIYTLQKKKTLVKNVSYICYNGKCQEAVNPEQYQISGNVSDNQDNLRNGKLHIKCGEVQEVCETKNGEFKCPIFVDKNKVNNCSSYFVTEKGDETNKNYFSIPLKKQEKIIENLKCIQNKCLNRGIQKLKILGIVYEKTGKEIPATVKLTSENNSRECSTATGKYQCQLLVFENDEKQYNSTATAIQEKNQKQMPVNFKLNKANAYTKTIDFLCTQVCNQANIGQYEVELTGDSLLQNGQKSNQKVKIKCGQNETNCTVSKGQFTCKTKIKYKFEQCKLQVDQKEQTGPVNFIDSLKKQSDIICNEKKCKIVTKAVVVQETGSIFQKQQKIDGKVNLICNTTNVSCQTNLTKNFSCKIAVEKQKQVKCKTTIQQPFQLKQLIDVMFKQDKEFKQTVNFQCNEKTCYQRLQNDLILQGDVKGLEEGDKLQLVCPNKKSECIETNKGNSYKCELVQEDALIHKCSVEILDKQGKKKGEVPVNFTKEQDYKSIKDIICEKGQCVQQIQENKRTIHGNITDYDNKTIDGQITLKCDNLQESCQTHNGDYMCSVYVQAGQQQCTAYFIPKGSSIHPDEVTWDVPFKKGENDEMQNLKCIEQKCLNKKIQQLKLNGTVFDNEGNPTPATVNLDSQNRSQICETKTGEYKCDLLVFQNPTQSYKSQASATTKENQQNTKKKEAITFDKSNKFQQQMDFLCDKQCSKLTPGQTQVNLNGDTLYQNGDNNNETVKLKCGENQTECSVKNGKYQCKAKLKYRFEHCELHVDDKEKGLPINFIDNTTKQGDIICNKKQCKLVPEAVILEQTGSIFQNQAKIDGKVQLNCNQQSSQCNTNSNKNFTCKMAAPKQTTINCNTKTLQPINGKPVDVTFDQKQNYKTSVNFQCNEKTCYQRLQNDLILQGDVKGLEEGDKFQLVCPNKKSECIETNKGNSYKCELVQEDALIHKCSVEILDKQGKKKGEVPVNFTKEQDYKSIKDIICEKGQCVQQIQENKRTIHGNITDYDNKTIDGQITLKCDNLQESCQTHNGDYMCSVYVQAGQQQCTAYFIPKGSSIHPDEVTWDVPFKKGENDEMQNLKCIEQKCLNKKIQQLKLNGTVFDNEGNPTPATVNLDSQNRSQTCETKTGEYKCDLLVFQNPTQSYKSQASATTKENQQNTKKKEAITFDKSNKFQQQMDFLCDKQCSKLTPGQTQVNLNGDTLYQNGDNNNETVKLKCGENQTECQVKNGKYQCKAKLKYRFEHCELHVDDKEKGLPINFIDNTTKQGDIICNKKQCKLVPEAVILEQTGSIFQNQAKIDGKVQLNCNQQSSQCNTNSNKNFTCKMAAPKQTTINCNTKTLQPINGKPVDVTFDQKQNYKTSVNFQCNEKTCYQRLQNDLILQGDVKGLEEGDKLQLVCLNKKSECIQTNKGNSYKCELVQEDAQIHKCSVEILDKQGKKKGEVPVNFTKEQDYKSIKDIICEKGQCVQQIQENKRTIHGNITDYDNKTIDGQITLKCDKLQESCQTHNGDYMCSVYVQAGQQQCTAYFIPKGSSIHPDEVTWDVPFKKGENDEMQNLKCIEQKCLNKKIQQLKLNGTVFDNEGNPTPATVNLDSQNRSQTCETKTGEYKCDLLVFQNPTQSYKSQASATTKENQQNTKKKEAITFDKSNKFQQQMDFLCDKQCSKLTPGQTQVNLNGDTLYQNGDNNNETVKLKCGENQTECQVKNGKYQCKAKLKYRFEHCELHVDDKEKRLPINFIDNTTKQGDIICNKKQCKLVPEAVILQESGYIYEGQTKIAGQVQLICNQSTSQCKTKADKSYLCNIVSPKQQQINCQTSLLQPQKSNQLNVTFKQIKNFKQKVNFECQKSLCKYRISNDLQLFGKAQNVKKQLLRLNCSNKVEQCQVSLGSYNCQMNIQNASYHQCNLSVIGSDNKIKGDIPIKFTQQQNYKKQMNLICKQDRCYIKAQIALTVKGFVNTEQKLPLNGYVYMNCNQKNTKCIIKQSNYYCQIIIQELVQWQQCSAYPQILSYTGQKQQFNLSKQNNFTKQLNFTCNQKCIDQMLAGNYTVVGRVIGAASLNIYVNKENEWYPVKNTLSPDYFYQFKINDEGYTLIKLQTKIDGVNVTSICRAKFPCWRQIYDCGLIQLPNQSKRHLKRKIK